MLLLVTLNSIAEHELMLNPSKSVAIISGTRLRVNNTKSFNPTIKISDTLISLQSCVNKFGVMLDESLHFEET